MPFFWLHLFTLYGCGFTLWIFLKVLQLDTVFFNICIRKDAKESPKIVVEWWWSILWSVSLALLQKEVNTNCYISIRKQKRVNMDYMRCMEISSYRIHVSPCLMKYKVLHGIWLGPNIKKSHQLREPLCSTIKLWHLTFFCYSAFRIVKVQVLHWKDSQRAALFVLQPFKEYVLK